MTFEADGEGKVQRITTVNYLQSGLEAEERTEGAEKQAFEIREGWLELKRRSVQRALTERNRRKQVRTYEVHKERLFLDNPIDFGFLATFPSPHSLLICYLRTDSRYKILRELLGSFDPI